MYCQIHSPKLFHEKIYGNVFLDENVCICEFIYMYATIHHIQYNHIYLNMSDVYKQNRDSFLCIYQHQVFKKIRHILDFLNKKYFK